MMTKETKMLKYKSIGQLGSWRGMVNKLKEKEMKRVLNEVEGRGGQL